MKSRIEKFLKWLQPHLPLIARVGRRLLRAARHVTHFSLYTVAGIAAVLAAVLVAARIYLPDLVGHKAEIEAFLGERSAHRVQIGQLATYWEGLSPGVHLEDVQVFAPAGAKPAVQLKAVGLSVAPLPLLWGELRIERLRLVQPRLSFERMQDGRFRIAGLEPVEAGTPEQGQAFIELLFRQHRIEIEDGEFAWRDQRHAEPPLYLKAVNLDLRNSGERHRLDFSAVFPPGVCDECRFTADITGNPLTAEDWEGRIATRAASLDVERLPGIFRERLPEKLRGRFALDLTSEWESAQPREIDAEFSAMELRLPIWKRHAPLRIHEAAGRLAWSARGEGWRLDLSDLTLALAGPRWKVGQLRLQGEPDRRTLRVQHLDIGALTQWAVEIEADRVKELDPSLSAPLVLWQQLRPAGDLNDLELRLDGPVGAPTDFSIEADISGLRTKPHGAVPGIENLSGHLTTDAEEGEFLLDSRALRVDLTKLFRAPLMVRRVTGRMEWEKTPAEWRLTLRSLDLEGEDALGTGGFTLKIPHDPARSPDLALRVDFRDGNGAHAGRYFPAHVLDSGTLAWMDRAFLGGRVVSGHVIYDGPVREYPFREGQGRFEIEGEVRNAVYQYLSGWEPLTAVQANVRIRDREVLVTGSGRLGKLEAGAIRVETAFGGAKGSDAVRIKGEIKGPLDETLRVVRAINAAPAAAIRDAYLPAGIEGRGDGVLQLDVTAPFGGAPVRLRGEYRVAGAGLKFSDSGVTADAIAGSAAFTEGGVQQAAMRAKVLGGDTQLSYQAPAPGQRNITASGVIHAANLAPVLGESIAKRLSGAADWELRYAEQNGVPDFKASVNLPGIGSELPAPLQKPKGLTSRPLSARSESASRARHVIALDSPGSLSGRLLWRHDKDGWHFDRGRVALFDATTALPPERGLSLHGRFGALDVDPWFALRSPGAEVPAWLTRVSADVAALKARGWHLGAMHLDLARSEQGWAGNVQGAALSGRVALAAGEDASRIDLDLAQLAIPDKRDSNPDEAPGDPRGMPHLAVRSERLLVKGNDLGAVDFASEPIADGWRISHVKLTRPEMTLDASADWRWLGGEPVSNAKLSMRTSDAGKTLDAFGMPGQLAGGAVELSGEFAWRGPLLAPRVTLLDGSFDIAAKKGRFLNLSQGAGQLFGLVDLSAIGRYLTLDFSPVFGKGFVYDEVKGTIAFEHGNAYTQTLSLKGPSARIAVNGRVGIAAEDFDLTIGVEPQLSTAVTLGSLYFLGPQVAAGVLAAQQLFKKQIAAGTRVTYTVKGSWQEPSVIRAGPATSSPNPEEPGG